METRDPIFWATSVIFKETGQSKQAPEGEKSLNLVTLAADQFNGFPRYAKRFISCLIILPTASSA
jgi:hypothetical protein